MHSHINDRVNLSVMFLIAILIASVTYLCLLANSIQDLAEALISGLFTFEMALPFIGRSVFSATLLLFVILASFFCIIRLAKDGSVKALQAPVFERNQR